jgi:hypothetical protein
MLKGLPSYYPVTHTPPTYFHLYMSQPSVEQRLFLPNCSHSTPSISDTSRIRHIRDFYLDLSSLPESGQERSQLRIDERYRSCRSVTACAGIECCRPGNSTTPKILWIERRKRLQNNACSLCPQNATNARFPFLLPNACRVNARPSICLDSAPQCR